MNLANYFTFDHFRQLATSINACFESGSFQKSNDQDYWEEKCGIDLALYMAALRSQGRLKLSDALGGRNRWIAAWNTYILNHDHPYAQECLRPLISIMMKPCYSSKVSDEAVAQRLHAEVCAKFDAGHFSYWDFEDAGSEPCAATGVRLRVGMVEGWQPVLLKYTPGGDAAGEKFQVITDGLPEQQVLHVAIPSPSGKMIAADWFRLEGNLFTSAVGARELNFEINYEFGRRAQTEHYAKELGFLSISVGNSSPSLLERDGHFVLASETGEDDPVGKPLGSICTDLWWATVVDEAVLRSLIERKHGAQGLQALDAYLAEDGNHFRFSVPRGTLHAYYSAGRKTLADFTPIGVDFNLDSLRTVHGVFCDHEIEWVSNAPKVAKSMCPRRA